MDSITIHAFRDELQKIASTLALPPMHPRAGGTGGLLSGALPKKPLPAKAVTSTPITKQVVETPSHEAASGLLPMHPASGVKLSSMEVDAGFLGDIAQKVKSVAMTDVGGPKGILQPAGQAAANAAPKGVKSKGFAAFQQQRAAAGM
jgi:hypothetical protein